MEKITFIYPTRILPGMVANALNTPDMVTYVSGVNQSISLYLYAGLVLDQGYSYNLEIDVFSEGRSILPNDLTVSDTTVLSQYIHNEDFISLSCSWVPSIKIEKEGMIEIKATLIKGDSAEADRIVLDTLTCSLLVRIENKGEV